MTQLLTANPHRRYLLFTHLYFVLAAVLAIVFYRERIQSDSAYYLFHVVDTENFRIEHQRYILAFSQFLPLIGIKLGLGMKAVMMLYSLNPVLWFYLLFLYCVFFLRDKTAGSSIILVSVLGVIHMFFCPMYEIWYGSALLVLVRSHLYHNRIERWYELLLFLGITITILFSHPLLLIPLVYLLLLDGIEKWWLHWKQLLAVMLVFGIWYAIKKLMLSEYETGKFSLLDFSWNKAYQSLSDGSYLWLRLRYIATYYTVPLIMVLITSAFYLMRGMRLRLFLLNAFFWGHILVINITHYHPDFPQSLYYERMYMPLVTIALLPFMYDVFTQVLLGNSFGGILIALAVGWRFWIFIHASPHYSAQLAKTDAVIKAAQKAGGSKFVLSPVLWKLGFEKAEWSFPMETMLYSSFDGPDKVVTIALPEDFTHEQNAQKVNENVLLVRRWDLRPNNGVNPRYFQIEKGPYRQLGSLK
ncbi:MAG: hypothetical protein MUC87_01995 [Bacteroidia bacterium]|jgi:hypothetical protein|nr:hypothetical protein [Bacteroidia bacterium]